MEKQSSLEIVISPEAGFATETGGAPLADAKKAFDTLGTLLTDAIKPFLKNISTARESADEIELQLSLSLKGEGKWVVVSVGASTSVSVKLVWKKT
jgi:inner membrane protein involved in colicin E2 resistance